MPQMTLTGHPLHPQLIVMPAGLLPFSLLLDVFHIKTRDQSFADAAYYTMMGGFVGGIAARSCGRGGLWNNPGRQSGETDRPTARPENRTSVYWL